MKTEVAFITKKLARLEASEFYTFPQVAALKNVMGVYMIYDDKGQLLYIGNTNKFNIRFGTDLKHETTHTLVRKLINAGQHSDRYQVVDYLKGNCKIKIEICDTKREAEALEHLAIFIFNPIYNK